MVFSEQPLTPAGFCNAVGVGCKDTNEDRLADTADDYFAEPKRRGQSDLLRQAEVVALAKEHGVNVSRIDGKDLFVVRDPDYPQTAAAVESHAVTQELVRRAIPLLKTSWYDGLRFGQAGVILSRLTNVNGQRSSRIQDGDIILTSGGELHRVATTPRRPYPFGLAYRTVPLSEDDRAALDVVEIFEGVKRQLIELKHSNKLVVFLPGNTNSLGESPDSVGCRWERYTGLGA